jgi:hypothetical protein
MAEIKSQLKLELARLRKHMRMSLPSNHMRLQQVVDESQMETQRREFRIGWKNVKLDKHQQARLQMARLVNYATPSLEEYRPLENHPYGLVGVEQATQFAGMLLETKTQRKLNGNCCTCRGSRANSKNELPRHAVGTRETKKETGRRKYIPQSAGRLSTRNAHPQSALRCCKRERKWIFATEFFSREKGNSRIQRNTRNAPGKENPSKRFKEKES